MVITDPNFLTLLQSAAAEQPRLEVDAAAKKGGANTGQTPDPSIQNVIAQPVAGSLTIDEQQAVRQVIQSLGVSAKLLDQLTAALGGTAEPVPPAVQLPQNVKTDTLEAATIRLFTGELLNLQDPEQTANSAQNNRTSSLQEASAAVARQILASLKQAELDGPPPANQLQLSRAGADQAQPLQLKLQIPPMQQATADLAVELKNLLQTTLWLRSIDQPAGQSNNLPTATSGSADSPQTGASAPQAAGILRLLTILQLTGAPDSTAASASAESFEKAVSTALTGSASSGSAADLNQQSTIAALLADPDGIELVATIGRSIEVVNRLLERTAPEDTEQLRQTLRDLGAALSRLAPPPALNPSAIRTPPPEPVRRQVAQLLTAARIEIDILINPETEQAIPPPFTPVNQQSARPVVSPAESSAGRLSELLTTIEKRGLDLVLHQISSLNGHEQWLSDMQISLEQDSLAATSLQTVKLLEKSLAKTDTADSPDPKLTQLKELLGSIEKVLADSLAKGTAPAAEKIEAALLNLTRLTAASIDPNRPAGTQAPLVLSKLQIAMTSLLEQQLTGLKLYSTGNPAGPVFQPLFQPAAGVPVFDPLTAAQINSPANPTALLRLINQPATPRNVLAELLSPLPLDLQNSRQTSEQEDRVNPEPAGSAAGLVRTDRKQDPQSSVKSPANSLAGDSANSAEIQLARNGGVIRPAAAQVNDQVRALASSLSLQLDLLAEQTNLPSAGVNRSVFTTLPQPVAAGQVLFGSGIVFDRIAAAHPGSEAPGSVSTGIKTPPGQIDGDLNAPIQASVLGPRINLILAKIDQLRQNHLAGDDDSAAARSADSKLLEVLHQTARRLQDRAGSADQPLSNTDLRQAVDKLETAFRDIANTARPLAGNGSTAEAIRQIETLIRGQEALSYLNPVMQALGEPTFILFPAVIHGMMIRVEMMLYPHVDPDAGSGSKRNQKQNKPAGEDSGEPGPDSKKRREAAEKQAFRRLKVGLTMPNLGHVAVDFAHTLQDALIGIAVEDNGAAAQLESSFPELKRTFNSLGYNNVDLSIKSDPSADLQPAWLQELLRVNAVAA